MRAPQTALSEDTLLIGGVFESGIADDLAMDHGWNKI
jgi:hypothetical protein